MSTIGPKQVDHIADWQEKVNTAYENIMGISPREQNLAIEVFAEFCRRFTPANPVFDTILQGRLATLEERLLELAESLNKFVASAAMKVLVQLGCRSGHEAALLHLESENPHLLEGAINLFALSAADDELVRLHGFLHHENRRVRNAVVRAFATRPYPPALADLLEKLSEFRDNVRNSFGSKNIHGAEARALLSAITRIQGADAIPLLVEIASGDVSMRTYAVKALMELDVQQVAPFVAHLLADRGASLVSEVLRLVEKADFRSALPLIRPLLRNPDGTVRHHALRILLKWEDSDSADAIFNLARQESSSVLRSLAVEGLAKLPCDKTEEWLTSLLGDLNVQVRKAAANALASLPELSQDSLLALEHLSNHDESDLVRCAALKACSESSGRTGKRTTSFTAAEDGPSALLIPPQLIESIPALLEYLRTWRDSLPDLAGNCAVQQINDLDHSLAMLIHALDDAA
jgi:HEAT repeat protein